jgi:hypothetical protein
MASSDTLSDRVSEPRGRPPDSRVGRRGIPPGVPKKDFRVCSAPEVPGLASPQAGLGGRGYTRKSRAHVADAATRRVSRNLNNGRDAGGEVLLSRAARTRRSGGWLV